MTGIWRCPASGRERLELVTGRARQRQRASQKGGAATGPNPTDRGKPGTKRHLVVDAHGTRLGLTLTGANCHDSRMLSAGVEYSRIVGIENFLTGSLA